VPTAEVAVFLAARKDLKLADGRDRLVRHGHGPTRTIQTGIRSCRGRTGEEFGTAGLATASGFRFTSAILPLWARQAVRNLISPRAAMSLLVNQSLLVRQSFASGVRGHCPVYDQRSGVSIYHPALESHPLWHR
jgi:hypothetical protein